MDSKLSSTYVSKPFLHKISKFMFHKICSIKLKKQVEYHRWFEVSNSSMGSLGSMFSLKTENDPK